MLKTFNYLLVTIFIISFFYDCSRIQSTSRLSKYYEINTSEEITPDKATIKKLKYALKDDNAHVRLYAAEKLGEFGPKSIDALPDLIETTNDINAHVRIAAYFSILKIKGKKESIDILKRGLADQNKSVRYEILRRINHLYKIENIGADESLIRAVYLIATYDTYLPNQNVARDLLYRLNLAKVSDSFDVSKNAQSSGSGFFLDSKGLLITNYHVIEGAEKIFIKIYSSEKLFPAETRIVDKNNDLAILTTKITNDVNILPPQLPYSLIKSKLVQVGEEIFTLGYPLSGHLGQTAIYSNGSINSKFGINDDPRLYQISIPLQPGNSGGPVFNGSGELVGIVVSGLNAKYFYENLDVIPQNVNFAIKSDYLINLLDMLPEGEQILKRPNLLLGKTKKDMIKMLEKIVVSINCE